MKLFSIITAILVAAFLYFLVLERDTLFAFASGGASEEIAAETDEVEEPAAIPEGVISVIAMASTAQTVDSAVVLRGRTEAARDVNVAAETGGSVVSAPLRKGSYVQKDQIMCELDPGTRAASVAEAMARVAEAQARVPETEARVIEAEARLIEAENNANIAQKLFNSGNAAETRVKSANAAVEAARAGLASATSGLQSTQAGIEAAQAGLAAAEKEVERLKIVAPFAGLLESDTAEFGTLMQAGSVCATVIQLDPIKLVGFVPETEVSKVTVGSLAGGRLADGSDVRGRVTFLSKSADLSTRTFRVEIEVPNGDNAIRDGQTAEILIASDGAPAHLLPQSAMTLNNDGDLGVRIVDADSIARFAPVTLLRDTVDGVWLAGLPETVNVIVTGQEYVVDGVPVIATYKEHNE